MNKAPGYLKWPRHRIAQTPLAARVTVDVDGEVIADSTDVVRVDEDRHPVRWYFPRADVRMDRLERSNTTTYCPFKGKAEYFDLVLGERRIKDAAWSYETPYDEHAVLKERLAFHDDSVPGLTIRPSS